MTTYLTKDGDMVDEIAFKQYGAVTDRAVEQVLAVNPGLADYGPVLPAGVQIALPVISTTSTTRGVKLWD